MSDPNITDSDSDVDSNSSWTLLTDEQSPQKKEEDGQSRTDESIEVIETPKRTDDEVKNASKNQHGEDIENVNSLWPEDMDFESSSSSTSVESLHPQNEEPKEVVQGCITFEEYLKEQELLKEYEFDEQASHWEQQLEKTKPRKKKYKKLKAEQVSTAKVVGAVLSLAGISFICMIAPYFTRQFVTSDLENNIDKNFTKIDSQYAKSHGYEVYMDNSEEAKAISQKPEAVEALARQCCLTHINSKGKISRKCTRCSRDQPTTLQKFLNDATKELTRGQELNKKNVDKEKGFCFQGEKPKPLREEEAMKESEKTKCEQQKSTKKITFTDDDIIDLTKDDDEPPQEGLVVIDKKPPENKKTITKKDTKKKISKKIEQKEKELKKSPDEPNKITKKKRADKPESKITIKKESKMVLETAELLRKIKSDEKELKIELPRIKNKAKEIKLNSKNLGVKKPAKSTLGFSKLKLLDIQPEPTFKCQSQSEFTQGTSKPYLEPYSKFENKQDVAQTEETAKAKDESPQIPKFSQFRCDYMACQLLQDIALLRITGKLKTVVQKRQKKLKRRIEKRKLRLMKNATEESDSEEEKKIKRPLKESTTRKLSKVQSVTNIKNATSQFNRDEIKLNKSNVEFLKELPFGKEYKEEKFPAVYIGQPKIKTHENSTKRTKESMLRISPMFEVNLGTEPERSPDRNTAKSLAFLMELQRKREEKLRDLEEMKKENRLRIEAIIKDRKSKQKKDACLGYYNIPVPEYEDVSEQLQKLKNKRSSHVGFICDSSDSDSDKTNCSFKPTENRVSAELMAALRVGKKVSDSFKEWTLKKAPTLTCLRKYCNSKVSQISERLTNSSTCNEKVIPTISKEELDCIRSRKERHEQLKKFWKAKQEYLDKRIEICNLLKEKLSGGSISESSETAESFSQGVHILDSIIADVLKSVKTSKSLHSHATLEENEVKRPCKSVCNMKNQVVCEAPRPTNDDLYRWLFERKAMMIKKKDSSSFASTVRENLLTQGRREFNKQDPCRGFHERLLKKYN